MTSPTTSTATGGTSQLSWRTRAGNRLQRLWGDLPLRAKGIVVVCPVVPLVVSITILFSVMARTQRQAETWLIHTHEVKQALNALQISVLSAESATRGYLLTGDPAWRRPYDQAVVDVPQQLSVLQTLVRDADALRHLEQVRVVANARMMALSGLLSYAKLRQPPRDLLETGRRLMDALRRTLDAMDAAEDRLLIEREAQLAETRRRTTRA